MLMYANPSEINPLAPNVPVLRTKMTISMIRFIFQLLLSLPFLGCTPDKTEMPVVENPPVMFQKVKLSMLALGDSYTIGQSVPVDKSFPRQLVAALPSDSFEIPVGSPRIIAKTGWRTDQLVAAIAQATDIQDSTFDLVTLCIGVNNQYQNGNLEVYKAEFEALLKTAIARAGNRSERVIVLSIPDWAFTPYGQQYPGGGAQITTEIDAYNAVNKGISMSYGVHYVDVTTISRQGLSRPELVASDGLHPSAEQYAEWARLLLPIVSDEL